MVSPPKQTKLEIGQNLKSKVDARTERVHSKMPICASNNNQVFIIILIYFEMEIPTVIMVIIISKMNKNELI